MKETSYDIAQLSDQEADSSLLTDIGGAFLNPVPLLTEVGIQDFRNCNRC